MLTPEICVTLQRFTIKQLYYALIITTSPTLCTDEEDQSCVAAFTALPRAKWAEVRKRLEENPVNSKILKLIDSALLVLVLQTDEMESTVSYHGV